MRLQNRILLVILHMSLAIALETAVYSQELIVWSWSHERHEQYKKIIEWYEEENPGVNVNIQLISGGQPQFTEKLMLSILSGAPPDLTWLEGSTVIELAAQGLLEDVTRALDDIRFTPADTEEMTYKGKMWGVPYHTTSRGLFKRVDLFDQSGLNPDVDPQSLDDLKIWHQKLTSTNNEGAYSRLGIVPWEGNWGPPAWMWTFGGRLIDESGLRPTATDPKNIRAFEWLSEWAQSFGVTYPVRGGYAGFMAGTVAMNIDSTTHAGRFLESGIEFITGRVPHPPGGQNGTWGGGQALGIPVNAVNKKEAMNLLRYFGKAEVQEKRFQMFPEAFPANWDALQAIGRTLPEAYASLIDQLPEARPRTPLWIDYYIHNLNPAVAAVIRGQKTPHQALEEVQQIMEIRFAEVFGEVH